MKFQRSKGKREGSSIQFQVEEELINVKADVTASLDRNSFLEEEHTKVRTELEKALQWKDPTY